VAVPLAGQPLIAGRNAMAIRGRRQGVYYYPATGKPQATVLFLPGDGGWRGFAIQIAQALADSGVDVYGWDIKEYLEAFTSGGATASQKDIQSDTANLAVRLGAGSSRKFVLMGWSQGAAMTVLAAGAPAAKELFSGVVVLGLPESGVLGWRFADNLTYVTKRDPSEPRFDTAPWLSAISPLRFGMIHSTADEYVSPETAKRLFALACQPKRLDLVSALNHSYEGNREDFFRILREQVKWAAIG
jgi:pimeloyl-ACP methyl ester carboxylesterase